MLATASVESVDKAIKGEDPIVATEAEAEPTPQVEQVPEETDTRKWCGICQLEIFDGQRRTECAGCWRPLHAPILGQDEQAGAQMCCLPACALREWCKRMWRLEVGCAASFRTRCQIDNDCWTFRFVVKLVHETTKLICLARTPPAGPGPADTALVHADVVTSSGHP